MVWQAYVLNCTSGLNQQEGLVTLVYSSFTVGCMHYGHTGRENLDAAICKPGNWHQAKTRTEINVFKQGSN